jgi:hypothetical protein
VVEGWKAIVFQLWYVASEPKDAEFGELKEVRLQCLLRPVVELD